MSKELERFIKDNVNKYKIKQKIQSIKEMYCDSNADDKFYHGICRGFEELEKQLEID